jgi:hypothetical protein
MDQLAKGHPQAPPAHPPPAEGAGEDTGAAGFDQPSPARANAAAEIWRFIPAWALQAGQSCASGADMLSSFSSRWPQASQRYS